VIDPLDVVHGATLETCSRASMSRAARSSGVKKAIKKNFGKGIPPMAPMRCASRSPRSTRAARGSGSRSTVVESYRNSSQKLWNGVAVRTHEPPTVTTGALRGSCRHQRPTRSRCERWILSRLQATAGDGRRALESYRFADAANAIWHFVWDELCDWYIELAKPHYYQGAELSSGMRAIGEAPRRPGRARDRTRDDAAPAPSVRAVRDRGDLAEAAQAAAAAELAHDHEVPRCRPQVGRCGRRGGDGAAAAGHRVVPHAARDLWRAAGATGLVHLKASPERRKLLEQYKDILERSAKVRASFEAAPAEIAAKTIVGADIELVMPLGGLIDVASEKARIAKEIEKAKKEVAMFEKKLANADFMARAPEEVIAEQRKRLAEEQERQTRLGEALSNPRGAAS